jgi:hypothetical protein
MVEQMSSQQVKSARRLAACALVLAGIVATAAPPARAAGLFQINLIPGPGLAANPDALDAFHRAAAEWEAAISNPIKVNITADLGPFAEPNIIGSTSYGSENLNLDYDTVRNAMAARASRPGNAVLAHLPTSAQLSVNVPPGAELTYLTGTIGILRANQKALGLIPNALTDNVIDGEITFNTAFTFDFDSRDGVDANKVDFQTAAAHEIGHVLGFVSDTDDYDTLGPVADNVTALDLFRFNASNKPTTFEQFKLLPRELRPGQDAVTSDTVNEYNMSTGAQNGDGNQASHWKDDFLFDGTNFIIGPLIGIMDPSLADGTIENVGPADLRTMELIGYDTPEPGAAVTFAALTTLSMLRTRRVRAGGRLQPLN